MPRFNPARPFLVQDFGLAMALDPAVRSASDEFLSAALIGGGWETALESLALSVGGRGAIIMKNNANRPGTILFSEGVRAPVEQFIAGRTPPSSRQERVPSRPDVGFRIDQDDYSESDLRSDPYYQEFLRQHGFFWHANATLFLAGSESVDLSIKREIHAGRFVPEDVAMLNRSLATLRSAVSLAGAVFNAQAAGMARLITERGESVFELNGSGEVLREHGPPVVSNAPVRVHRRQLAGVDRRSQTMIDLAMARARAGAAMSVVELPAMTASRWFLKIVRIAGAARDVFLSTTLLAILVCHPKPSGKRGHVHRAIREAFALTEREADVAELIGQGMSIEAISEALGLTPSTLRSYLKQIFQKTSTSRQGDLTLLIDIFRN